MGTQPTNLDFAEPGQEFITNKIMARFFMQAPTGMFFLRGPQLVLEFANKIILELWGKPLHEVLGKSIWDIIPGAKTQENEDLCNRVFYKGEKIELDTSSFVVSAAGKKSDSLYTIVYTPFQEDDGSISGIMVYSSALISGINKTNIRDDSKVHLKDVVDNSIRRASEIYLEAPDINNEKLQEEKLQRLVDLSISELVKENEALRKSEERYHKMVEEVQDYAIILLDTNGIIQNWNKGALHIKQYTEEEAVGRHFRMFYLPEDRANKLPELLLNTAVREGRAIHEGWRLRKNQAKFWGSITLTALHDQNNEVIGFSKVTRDLTERKNMDDQLLSSTDELRRSNEALKKSEEKYHKMIAEVQDYAIILLDEEGNIQNWNAGAENIKGYSASEIMGKNFNIFYTKSDREQGLPNKLLAEASNKGKAIHEGWRVRKDGSVFWGSIVISALHSQDGTIIGFSKVTRDLTERKKAADKIQEYLVELEAQNKELGQFAYIASHDLQEPLRKIQTFTELIEANIHDEHAVLKYFNKIKASAERMTELIKSVLNYSQLSNNRQEMVDIDLNKVMTNVLEDFELLIQEKGAVVQSEKLPVIKAIAPQMIQLFSNLISNAFKYNDKQPVLEISSRLVTKNEIENCPKNVKEGNYFQIAFRDNGIGFEQKYDKVIFSMFQRLHGKQQYAGTGIGLALCKKIMDNHGGFITVDSEVSKGTVFNVYFPEKMIEDPVLD